MHSFASCLIHCVWSTKHREPWLTPDLRERLWPYLGGIAKQNQMKALAIGGAVDHVHILLSLPATLSNRKSDAASERKFIQMDSRSISDDAFLCLAGRLRRIQRWYFWPGYNRDIYQQSNRASPEAIFSRGVHSDASQAPF
jgi:REP element-mobilizing transposase RayT